jgi:hypothetical protein
MRKQAVLFSLLLTPFLFAGAFFYAYAHAGEEHSASYNLAAISITQDEKVDLELLGVSAPKILPGSPLYFFKNLSRGVRSTVTFGAEKKAELKLQFANEKIAEAQILSERGDNSRAAEHLKSYEKDLARARAIADKEKFITQSIKHQAVIDKIEKGASEEQVLDINNVREKTIGHIAEAVGGIEDKEAAKSALIAATSDEGSAFKPIRNLEILKAVEEKVPEQAKDAIRAAQENAVKRFKSEYDKGTVEEKDALTDYIKSAGGDASRYIGVFNENKEILGEELSGKLLSAGEEKKVTTGAGPTVFSSSNVECITPAPPKPSVEPQSAFGTMTVTPEISNDSEDNTITISLTTHIDALTVEMYNDPASPIKGDLKFSDVVDWGPKPSELPREGHREGQAKAIFNDLGYPFIISWQTRDYDDNTRNTPFAQRRPRLAARTYWIKLKARTTTPADSVENTVSYGWKEVKYNIHYVIGDGSTPDRSDWKTVHGKSLYYVGGPQLPSGEVVRVGVNTKPHYGKRVTVKAGEPFEIEAKPIWQGGTMTINTQNSAYVIGPSSIAVKAGESAIWKVLPKGTNSVDGFVKIKNNCNTFFTERYAARHESSDAGSFRTLISYDFSGLTKEKARLSLDLGGTYVLDFAKPDSVLYISPMLGLAPTVDGKQVSVGVPETDIVVQAVYKDNTKEIAKSILITPVTAKTNKEGKTSAKITAPNITKEEVSRGIVLKLTAPSMPGLTFEQKLLFSNITIDITPKPVVEKKEEPKKEEPKVEVKPEEPKAEIKKEEPKPYEGSPPLMY